MQRRRPAGAAGHGAAADGRPGRLDRAKRAPHDRGRGLDHALSRRRRDLGRRRRLPVATGIDYLRALTDAGLDVETAARQITFSMGLGCRFYLAIAKIRAARKLWADVIAASGGSAPRPEDATARLHRPARADHAQPVAQHPAQHRRLLCRRDRRARTSSPPRRSTRRPACRPRSSRRNARNTQLILAEECHLAQVIDPAGGSWYIEWYTDELAKRAWSVFQQIEAQGGMIKAAGSGWVAEQIKPAEAAREKDIAARKVAITGVSEHPTSDRAPHRAGAARLPRARDGGGAAPVQLAAPACAAGGARRPGRRRPPASGRAHRGRDRRGGGRRHARPDRQAAGGRKAASRR